MSEYAFLDNLITLLIILFLILMIWSRIQHQRMLDTVNEIKDMFREQTEVIKK